MAVPEGYDFCGWATRNDQKCADGRVIRKDAFKGQDGMTVPLVWGHKHGDVLNVLGHAILENRPEGVYTYGYFDDTPRGNHAKASVKNGSINSLSIWANNLQQTPAKDVLHGVIREVSLVLAGANPGAFIESVAVHGMPMEDGDEECILYTGEDLILEHAIKEEEKVEDDNKKTGGEKTVADVYNSFTDEQKEVVAIIVGQAVADAKGEGGGDDDEGGDDDMKHNVFDAEGTQDERTFLSHDDMKQIFADAKRCGSLKAAVSDFIGEDASTLVHSAPMTGMTGPSSSTSTQSYGFRDPDMLFPEYRNLTQRPEWIGRRTDWVQKVMNGVRHTPFSRVKTMYADITEDDARARGYIKGKQKKEEVFTLLKRTTDPQTIYKKQKMDRDDVIDIVDFDVIAWIKAEMRVMLDEEIARAILLGDGRAADSDDKIQENHIRPIVKDVALYNTRVAIKVAANATEGEIAKATINGIIRSRKNYKGSGNPTFFTTEDVLTEMLLLEDGIGHKLYKTEAELATALRVSGIQTIELMEGYTLDEKPLIGCIVNLTDYVVGADKGGAVAMFEDFDIDYNQQKYLIETRISGALVKPFSALTVVLDKATTPSGSNS